MKSRTRVMLGVGGAVLVALLVVPFVLPLGSFIPEIERVASEQLRAPVKVDSLRLFFLPIPHLSVKGIVVGKQPFLEVDEVVVFPQLSSLLSDQRVISVLSLRGVTIGQALIAKASAWASRSNVSGPAPVRIDHVEVRNAFVNLAEFKLRDIDVDLDLTPQGGPARAQVRADNAHLNATLIPRAKDFAIEIAASDWMLPAGPPLLMSSLTASGTLIPRQGLTLEKIEGRLYDGTVSGKLNVGWAKDWTIAGNLEIHDVEIQPVVALLTKEATMSGRLNANPVVDMHAPSAAKLGEAVDVEADFKVENGILHKLDLNNAPKALVNKDALKGGQTRFDKLTGHLGVDSAGYYLTKVEIASGVLSAEAELSVSSKQELTGQIDVALKGTSGIVSTPLILSGTVQNPSVYPSKAALTGAAAGTVLLGPGLGTAAGMNAARLTRKLFGGGAAKKADKPHAPDPADAPKAPPVHTGR